MTTTAAPSPAGLRKSLSDLATLSARHWFILLTAFALQVVDGFDLVALSFGGKSIATAWGLSPTQLGVLFSAAPMGSLLGSLVVGLGAGRLGRKRLLMVFTGVVGAGSLATVFTRNFPTMLACRAMTGMGLGAVLPLLVAYAAEFSPVRVRGVASALVVSGGMTGITLSGLIAAVLLPAFGWPSLFVLGGTLPLVLLVLLLFTPPSPVDLVRTEPAAAEALCRAYDVPAPDAQPARSPGGGPLRIERSYMAPLIAIIIAVPLASLVSLVLTTWIPTLLQDRGLSLQYASLCASFLGAGGAIGILAGGAVMDRVSPYFVLGGAFLAAVGVLAAMAVVASPPSMIFALCFLAGFTVTGGIMCHFAFANLMFPNRMRVGVMALITWLGRLAGIVGPSGAGFLLAHGGSGAILFAISAALLLAAALAQLIPGLLTRRAARHG